MTLCHAINLIAGETIKTNRIEYTRKIQVWLDQWVCQIKQKDTDICMRLEISRLTRTAVPLQGERLEFHCFNVRVGTDCCTHHLFSGDELQRAKQINHN